MTEKNSIVEEAIIQMKNLEELVAENAKGILASTMRQEIKDLVKESLNEADEDEEEVEDEMEFDSDVADVEFDSDEKDEDEEEDYEGMEDEDEMEDDEDVIDLTNEPMSTVMKVFKKIGPDDEIEVQKDADGNIHLIDHENDNEYMIMSESEMNDYFGDMDEEEEELPFEDQEDLLGDLLPMDEESYYGDMEEEMDMNMEEDETIYEIEMDDAEFDFEDMDEEETLYEIEVDSEEDDEEFYPADEMFEMDDYMMEAKKEFKAKGMKMGKGADGFQYGQVFNYKTKKMSKGDELPSTSGKSVKYEFDMKSPSLKGEFKEGKYGMNKGDKSKTHKGEEDYTGKKGLQSKTHKGLDFKKAETKEASRTLGNGSNFRKGGLPKPRAHSGFNANIEESYNNQELEILREKNEEYRKALNVFRNKLNEVAVFNSNLAYATRLFTEHSTSKQEKINILKRFDGVETIKESKNLYKNIKDELTNSKGQQVNESVERVIEKTPSTGSAINLIESKTYENPQFMRMKDLMSKLK